MSYEEMATDELWLVRLTELLEVDCDRADVIRHLETSRREHPESGGIGAEAFALAGRRAGLRVAPFRDTLSRAVERATRETPLLARA